MQELADAVRAGDRRALAQAITLVESSRADHRADANALLDALMPATGDAVRVGITGAPGAGKSTFIEALGHATRSKPATSSRCSPSIRRARARGGSILGDKTRMERLAREQLAFIRPSPSGGTLGGVARRTREAMLVCEAAACDVVIVETVGVGQSEVAVAGMVDVFVLLLAPGGGDELQGVKRGIVELADLLVVNKADGELEAAARRTAADYASALHIGHAGERRGLGAHRLRADRHRHPRGVGRRSRTRSPPRRESGRAARDGGPSRRGRGCGPRCRTRCWSASAPIPDVRRAVDGLEADVRRGAGVAVGRAARLLDAFSG